MLKDTILVADDEEVNRLILEEILKSEYNVICVDNGEEALGVIQMKHECIVAVLLDLEMPVMNGYQVLDELMNIPEANGIPIVVETAEDNIDAQLKVFDYGVTDVVSKPYNQKILLKRMRNVITLNEYRRQLESTVEEKTNALNAKVEELARINSELLDALSSVVEFRDLETGEHIKRIKDYTNIICNTMLDMYPDCGLTTHKAELITSASAMHDIGKIAIPDAILLKPGKLSAEEFEVIKSHTTKGVQLLDTLQIIADSEYLTYCKNICLYHHEKYDGKGYPEGLKGEEIPIEAQIVSIADVFDALVSKRVYKDAYSIDEAWNMIKNGECGLFSDKILSVFDACFQRFKIIAEDSFAKEKEKEEKKKKDADLAQRLS